MPKKKVVEFHGFLFEPAVGRSASLTDVKDHPKLGDCEWVRTSRVVEIRDNGKTIETRNTIYKQVDHG